MKRLAIIAILTATSTAVMAQTISVGQALTYLNAGIQARAEWEIAHTNDANAHASIFADYLPLAGGTVTGSVLSTIDHTVTAPSNNEFPTAGWVSGIVKTNHNELTGRDASDAHPISAITGLTSALSNNVAYTPWSGTITPANGTATVTYAVGNMPKLEITSPTVVTLDPTSYGTSGVSRVALSLYCGTNSVTLSTNVITYATTPTLSTNSWNTILIRRVSNDSWKGVQL